MRSVAQQLGVPSEILVIALCLLSSFPLAIIYNCIPKTNPATRHWFSILTTSLMVVIMFDVWALMHLLVPTLVIYGLVFAKGSNPLVPVSVFVGVIVHLSFVHLQAQYWYADDPDFVDISTPLMVLAIRLSSFAWSVYDGSRPAKDLAPAMKPYVIEDVPDLVEFLGFIFFFATFWTGPAYDYRYYYEYTRNMGPYQKPLPTAMACFKVFLTGLLLLVLFLVMDARWGAMALFNGPFFTDYTLIQRLAVVQITGFSVRAKLSAAWKFSEAAGILTGLGCNGIDPKTNSQLYNRLENVNIRQVELGQCPREIIEGWNKKTAGWLKRCVYLRVAPWTSSSIATGITNLVSAFWHGLYPGFYLSFGSGIFVVLAGRMMRKYLRPHFVGVGSQLQTFKPVYDVLGCICTVGVLNYLFTSFFVRWAYTSLKIWAAMYYAGHCAMLAVIVGLWVYGKTLVVRGRPSPPHPHPSTTDIKSKVE
ncbi:hypothetical protein BASA50_001745 [Batrachochytrium salamandrivorans]|uniref:MBOAT family protein n=1 Tax=Batrachochytrium salamandrivorans TaxID=1357716 RepID=A0ABQ8FRC3_9FUNG|nr:hypothetical protein BASA61_009656 [Batrachochytrium salamandrivorans]KAH6601220.1 hypothetical protein BASA50_001745 [Batrachochytrium salamandrivorans]KAH9268639.1 hypothetical protein BASA83_009271 [Batrachochytrium salamandrivorans]KAJ1343971.1 hypothetical protein BSLG_001451 [Batrachochytrium salamandrivorans]